MQYIKSSNKTMKNSNICRLVAVSIAAGGSIAAQSAPGDGGETWRPPYITDPVTNSAYHTFKLENNFLKIEGVVSLDYAKAWIMRWRTKQFQIHLAPEADAESGDSESAGCLASKNEPNPELIKMDMYDKSTLAMITGGTSAPALSDTPSDTTNYIFVNQEANSAVFDTLYMAADNPSTAKLAVQDTNTDVRWGINGYIDGSTVIKADNFTAGYTGNAGFGVNAESTWTFEASDVAGTFKSGSPTTICDVRVPVTLSYAYMSTKGNSARFSWATGDESNNLGFHLWAKVDGNWQLLNQSILATASPDSIESNRYSWSADIDGDVEAFGISQVDTDGTETFYGPYAPGVRYGSADSNQVIDWKSIREELDANMIAKGFEPVAGSYVRKTLSSNDDVVFEAISQAASTDSTSAVAAAIASSSADSSDKTAEETSLETAQSAKGVALVANLRVKNEGVVRVGFAELAAMNIDLSNVESNRIALINRGRPVSRYIGTDTNGNRFVEFYAEEVDGIALQSTRENVYQLSVESEFVKEAVVKGQANSASGSFVASSIVEADNHWIYSYAPSDDQWFMGAAVHQHHRDSDSGQMVDDYVRNFSVNNIAISNLSEGFGIVSADVQNAWDSVAGAEADYGFYVNGELVGSGVSDSNNKRTIRAIVSSDQLNEGDNSVEIRIKNRENVWSTRLYVDNVSIKYPTKSVASSNLFVGTGKGAEDGYQISGFDADASLTAYAYDKSADNLYRLPVSRDSAGNVTVASVGSNPRKLVNYWVGSAENLGSVEVEMVNPNTSTDISDANYVIIAHENFSDTIANEYVGWKQGQSYYDAAGNKVPYKVAMVELKDIYDYYGGGLVDPSGIRNYLTSEGLNAVEHVMLVGNASIDYGRSDDIYNFIPTYYQRATFDQLAPNDGWLVDRDLDKVPDIAIGRLPVRDTAGLSALLEKTKDYAARTDTGLTVVYDDMDDPVNEYYAQLASSTALHHKDQYTELSSVDLGNQAVREGVVKSLNDSVATMIVQTHGDAYSWSGGLQNRYAFMNNGVSKGLNETGRGTLLYAMTCFTTFFPSTRYDSMSNILMNNRYGAVAMAGSSVVSFVGNNVEYTKRSIELTQRERKTIGQALRQARYETRTVPSKVISSVSWNLLGDPTVRSTLDNVRSQSGE